MISILQRALSPGLMIPALKYFTDYLFDDFRTRMNPSRLIIYHKIITNNIPLEGLFYHICIDILIIALSPSPSPLLPGGTNSTLMCFMYVLTPANYHYSCVVAIWVYSYSNKKTFILSGQRSQLPFILNIEIFSHKQNKARKES